MIIQQASDRAEMPFGFTNVFPIKRRFMTYKKTINYSQKRNLFYKHMCPLSILNHPSMC